MDEDRVLRQPGDGRAGRIRAFLAEAAAPRELVTDDHMIAVDRGGIHPATFRLQLFTAPGRRPVAVVVQQTGEGAGLINEGEHYVAGGSSRDHQSQWSSSGMTSRGWCGSRGLTRSAGPGACRPEA